MWRWHCATLEEVGRIGGRERRRSRRNPDDEVGAAHPIDERQIQSAERHRACVQRNDVPPETWNGQHALKVGLMRLKNPGGSRPGRQARQASHQRPWKGRFNRIGPGDRLRGGVVARQHPVEIEAVQAPGPEGALGSAVRGRGTHSVASTSPSASIAGRDSSPRRRPHGRPAPPHEGRPCGNAQRRMP
jgi:hypothetical protein